MANEDLMTDEGRYFFGKTPLGQIRNRNEHRVLAMLTEVLGKPSASPVDSIDIQDIYALALNKLPAHYVQETAIVLQETVDDETVRLAVQEAVEMVRQKPNHG